LQGGGGFNRYIECPGGDRPEDIFLDDDDRAAFMLIDGSPRVEQLGADYFAMRVWSTPATLANLAILGWFVGMQNTMFFSTALIFMPVWYLLLPYGNHGLWLAFTLFMASRGLTMAWVYRTVG